MSKRSEYPVIEDFSLTSLASCHPGPAMSESTAASLCSESLPCPLGCSCTRSLFEHTECLHLCLTVGNAAQRAVGLSEEEVRSGFIRLGLGHGEQVGEGFLGALHL